jgi:hypothetical protein
MSYLKYENSRTTDFVVFGGNAYVNFNKTYHNGLNFRKIKEVFSDLVCPGNESVWLSVFVQEFKISGHINIFGFERALYLI